jgi:large subunit ribosomal protein L17
MNQAEVGKLIGQLRFKVQPKAWKIKDHESNNQGLRGRLLTTRKTVTELIQNERLELSYSRGIVAREYTERLIQEAVTHGDLHKPTMELADWWLKDKSLVHKLFKVLVPRFQDMDSSYTRFFHGPYIRTMEPQLNRPRVIVELKGHPFPPLSYSNVEVNRGLISNVLLAEARRESRLRDEFKKAESK